jgi:hypothetical protein
VNCIAVGSFTSTSVRDYKYSTRNSSYVELLYYVNLSKIGPVLTTPNYNLIFSSSTPAVRPYVIMTANGSDPAINVSFENINMSYTSTDYGETWTSYPRTADVWLSRIGNYTQFQYKVVCYDNSDNKVVSSIYTSDIGKVFYPPSATTVPWIYSAFGGKDYDINGTHSGNITFLFLTGMSPSDLKVSTNASLMYSGNSSFAASINSSFGSNGIDLNLSFDSSLVADGNYTIYTRVTDDLGKVTEYWRGNFTINNSMVINISFTSPVNNSHQNLNVSINISVGSTVLDSGLYNVTNSSGALIVNGTLTLGGGGYSAEWNTTSEQDGNYTLWVWVNDSFGTEALSYVNITVDNTFPVWYLSGTPRTDNGTIVNYPGRAMDAYVQDGNLYQVSVNITNSSGGVWHYNLTNVTAGTTRQNVYDYLNVSSWPDGVYNVELSASDSHTGGDLRGLNLSSSAEGITLSRELDGLRLDILLGEYKDKKFTAFIGSVLAKKAVSFSSEKVKAETKSGIGYDEYKFGAIHEKDKDKLYAFRVPKIGTVLVDAKIAHFVWKDWYIDFSDMVAAGFSISVEEDKEAFYVTYSGGCENIKSAECVVDPVVGGLNTRTENYALEVNNVCRNLTTANTEYLFSGNGESESTCINIQANNVTVDCAEYSINYATEALGYGIYSANNYTTIRNCSITDGAGGVTDSHGISLNGALYATVNNNTINTSEYKNYGISIYGSAYSLVFSNNIKTSGLFGNPISLAFANNSNISNNVLNMGGNYSYGILLEHSSNNNTAAHNDIVGGDFDSGIAILGGGRNVISNNTINISGDIIFGLRLSAGDNHTVSYNTINLNGTNAVGVGLVFSLLVGGSLNNSLLIGNTINVVGGTGFVITNDSVSQITNGSISGTSVDYSLIDSGFSNNFSNTNFTTKKIELSANTSGFNYNMNPSDNVWLKTVFTVSSNLSRTLIKQTALKVEFNESATISGTGKYNLSGLSYSTSYNLKRNGVLVQNITSSASGELNFSAAINSTSANIVLVYGGAPNITVWYPSTNLTLKQALPVWNFSYTDTGSGPMNCSLKLNGITVASNSSVLAGTYTYLTPNTSLSEGLNNWTLTCTNDAGSNDLGSDILYQILIFLNPVAGLSGILYLSYKRGRR